MVRATRFPRLGNGSAARSAARRREDTAMERRGAQAFSDRKEGPCTARCTFWALRGAPSPRHAPREEEEDRPPRAFENRGDAARLSRIRHLAKPVDAGHRRPELRASSTVEGSVHPAPTRKSPMVIGVAHLQPIVALLAGILILIVPRLLNFIVAAYLIVIGLIGLGIFR